MPKYEKCRCYSGLPYHKCCGPLHEGKETATNARAVMRSRFCAYAMGLPEYLMNTTHKENEEYLEDRKKWADEILQFSKSMQFADLKVDNFIDGDDVAYVEFRATLRNGDAHSLLQERSKFVKENGVWLYHSGEISTPAAAQ